MFWDVVLMSFLKTLNLFLPVLWLLKIFDTTIIDLSSAQYLEISGYLTTSDVSSLAGMNMIKVSNSAIGTTLKIFP